MRRVLSRPFLQGFLPRLAILAFLLLCMLAIAVLSTDVARRIKAQETAQSDNIQWLLSQVDVEFLVLEQALEQALSHGGGLTDVRLRFDVFYSRMGTLNRGELFRTLKQDPDYLRGQQIFSDFFARTLPLIDGPDDALRAAVPTILADLQPLRMEARAISLAGIKIFAQISDAERQSVSSTLIQLSAITGLLVFALLVLVVVLSILDRANRQRARELRLSLDRIQAVFATARDAVIVTDALGRVMEFNEAAVQMFGHPRSEVVGRQLAPIIMPAGEARSPAPPYLGIPGGAGRLRQTAQRKDGTTFACEVSLTEAGPPGARFFVAFLRDLSPEVAAEQALLTARDEALAGERAKADLLAVMSHEMRTPLNGLLGTMELLEGTSLTARQRDYLRVMGTSGRLLLDHVNNVLEISRHDAGKAEVQREPVDLRGLVADIFDSQRALADAQGNRLILRLPPPPDDRVLGDAAGLRQVLLNLVGNAIKFTRKGEISVEVEHLPGPTPGTPGQTEYRVSDTGIGIPEAALERIFEDFVTLDTSYARATGGTGLGLGIARRMVTAMGGEIGVESLPGEGSLFWFRLPHDPVGTAPAGPAAASALPAAGPRPRPLRLLLVEDNPVNRLVTSEMLRQGGHAVTEAHDGAEAVTLAAEQHFDVVLMDISMPRMDGVAATRAIRALSGPAADVPILALTANALPGETERFLQAGMQGVLTKPVSAAELQARLASLAPSAARPAAELPVLDRAVLAELTRSLGAVRLATLMRGLVAEGEAAVSAWAPPARPEADPATLGRQAHRLAGACAVFGARRVQARLAALEEACNAGQADAIPPALSAALAACNETKAAVQSLLADMTATPAEPPVRGIA